MKNLLGAIAAAMLLGAGCAHERTSTTQSEAPSSPRAAVSTAGVTSGLTCEVINGNASGVSSSAPVTNESSDAWGGSSSEFVDLQQVGPGGDAAEQSASGSSVSGQNVIEGPASSQEPIDSSASDPSAIDDPAPQSDISEGEAIGGSGSEMDVSESNSFEDTDMGGTGGGGG